MCVWEREDLDMACSLGQPLPWDQTRRDPSQSQSLFTLGGGVVEQESALTFCLLGCEAFKRFFCSFGGCAEPSNRGQAS